MLRSLALSPVLAVLGCGADEEPAAVDVDEPTASVDIGLPAGDDGLGFESLAEGGELRLQSFGQGGTHILFGIRTVGFGTRAFVTMALENVETGAEVISPAPVRPQLFICENDVCDLVPLLVMTAGLTETGTERTGVVVEVRADVHNDAGVEASVARKGVLNAEDL